MGAVRNQKKTLIVFCILLLALYVYGVISADCIPSYIEGVALPFDFMVGIPLGLSPDHKAEEAHSAFRYPHYLVRIRPERFRARLAECGQNAYIRGCVAQQSVA